MSFGVWLMLCNCASHLRLRRRGRKIAKRSKWLSGRPPLRLVRVHELLFREGLEALYATLWRYAHEELGWREPAVTVRIDDPPPGDEVQVDFGKTRCGRKAASSRCCGS